MSVSTVFDGKSFPSYAPLNGGGVAKGVESDNVKAVAGCRSTAPARNDADAPSASGIGIGIARRLMPRPWENMAKHSFKYPARYLT